MDIDVDDRECHVVAVSHPEPPITPFPGFRKGNIVRVQMKDFLTFSNTVIHPGPRMNVILGPNGTGKSTVVSAVCIVFAGNPKLLGRSPDLGAFVKHGERKATIEALLYDPDLPQGVRSIKRTFDSDGRSHYEIDGERARQADVVSKVNRKYDIQLDNLSQFMPQEKIADFVNHKPEELLGIAVRSLGGTEKENEFADLTILDRSVGNQTEGLRQNEAKLEELLNQQQAEAAEVEAFRQQEEIKKRIKLCKQYRPHIEAEQFKMECVDAVAAQREIEEEEAVLKQQFRNTEAGSINALQQEVDAVKESFVAAKEASKEASKCAQTLVGEVDDISVKLSQKSEDLEESEERKRKWDKRIQETETSLANAEKEFHDGNHDEKEHKAEEELGRLREQMDKIRNDLATETARRTPIDQQRQTAARRIKHYNHKLAQIGDIRHERIRSLSKGRNGRYLIDCASLVHEMKSRALFRGAVFGPIAAEIEVDNSYHAKIMETCISGFFLTAFVTETAHDSRVLIAECKKRFGWAPDIITAPTTTDDHPDEYAIRAQVPARPVDERLRGFGIVAVVNDVFRCPDVVRAALNAQAGLHNIHVGTEHCDTFRDQLRLEEGVQAWFSPSSRCHVLRSRFDASVRSLSVETSFANRTGSFFQGNMNESVREKDRLAGLIRDEEDMLRHGNEQMQQLEGRVQELNASMRQTNADIRQKQEQRLIGKRKLQRIEMIRRKLEDFRRQVASRNVEQAKARLEEEIQKLQDEAIEKIPQAASRLRDLRSSMGRLDDCVAKRLDAERRLATEKAKHSEFERKIREKRKEVDEARKAVKVAKVRYKNKRAEARGILPQARIDENPDVFGPLMGKDLEWLEEEIARQEGQIEGLGSGGHQAVERYEHRQRKINRLSADVEQQRSQYSSKLEELRTRKSAFLDWLQGGIDKMRAKFSSLYRRLGCAGDLELANKDSDRIGDLELQILVSYRDDAELRPISFAGNSGGEKMCCTMLFCFSLMLEEERIPPFLFVDELNQGLDPSNEMKIMKMMFEDALNDSAPQSFVITPKLLLNLPFHEQTKTHIIFNGTVNGKIDVTAATSG